MTKKIPGDELPPSGININIDYFADRLSDQGREIIYTIAPVALENFARKNADYGDTSFDLGIAGQYAELWRKVGKLKGPMWEGKALEFEQMDEILQDLIGHCLLSLYFLHTNEAERITPVASKALNSAMGNHLQHFPEEELGTYCNIDPSGRCTKTSHYEMKEQND
ncbi:hypothetical protein PBI_LAMBO_70 [Gordonia phage Lambo]|uniref:Uncharacterized protein n=3 Tax=Lambovirus TaxID=2843412 RepID=A0A5J6TIC1_9CAUD|nr:hypothetical protein HWC68_gp74 [Gordonia phage Gibbin]YP_009852623.1 hypothetical protein HWC70_gp70 [Gordonia phage Lambo]WNO26293.1 hypothetical protein SEA_GOATIFICATION_72 [Gordonia phage GOATification]WNO27184.1 hypothetical protein SEA_FULCRUM_72 [Gordonia phage Fulcrum]QFG10611.1 hypothetical protein PBI_GIBBIN_74 [Gordonia phage Gibbin]QFG13578.1 hypothetical protein PBI_LAMBO_70 [Gordonia phage Lambo]